MQKVNSNIKYATGSIIDCKIINSIPDVFYN